MVELIQQEYNTFTVYNIETWKCKSKFSKKKYVTHNTEYLATYSGG